MTATTTDVRRLTLGTVDRMTLRDAVKWVRGAVSFKSNALPALKSIVVEVEGDMLAVRATDLDVAVEVLVPFDRRRNLHLDEVLPLDNDALNRATMIDGDTLLLEVVDGLGRNGDGIPLVEVTGEKLTARVNRGCATEDYPAMPDLLDAAGGTPLIPMTLAHLAHLTTVASTDTARPVLNGVYFDGQGGAATTDSYRLAVTSTVPAHVEEGLVPASLVKRITGLTDVRVRMAGDMVRFVGTHVAGPKSKRRRVLVRVAANLIEGSFPNYKRLLPENSKDDVILSLTNPGAFASSLKDGSKLLTAPNSPVTLSINGRVEADASAFRFDVEADTLQHGMIPLDGEDDTALRWAANPAYLADGLAMLADVDPHGVTARFRDGLKPSVFASSGLTYLLMPMRVD